jgi:predicted nucleotidyltransferase
MKNGVGNGEILLKALREAIEEEEGVLFAYLYGSHAYGDVHSESDIDVAVYLKPSDMKEYLEKEKRILSALIDRVRTDRIDLRILNVMPLVFQYNVLKDGTPILIKDEQARVDFETRVMNRFFELKPYLDEYKEMLISRIRAGIQE